MRNFWIAAVASLAAAAAAAAVALALPSPQRVAAGAQTGAVTPEPAKGVPEGEVKGGG